jgi:threonine dehydrogenase-like Zn-dependent dehydrogenase
MTTTDAGTVADARAFWVAAPGQGAIRSETLPAPGPDDVIVRTLYSGVSRGTESLVFRGLVPVSERERMRAPFQAGDFPAPVKYGYANVGCVEHAPTGSADLEGRTVFSLYPHQTRFVVPRRAVHVVPAGVPAKRAVLAANVETALNVVWDAAPLPGDRVVVIGAGTVGCLVAWLVGRVPGCRVLLVDVSPMRATIAEAFGVSFAMPPEMSGYEGRADLVVHASGSPDGLRYALRVAAFEARVIEASWYGAQIVPLPLGEGFHAKRLTIVSSQVGHVAPAQRPRWDTARRMELALELLADPAFDLLVTGESRFDDLPAIMARLAAEPGHELCHRIRYS